MVWDIFQPLCGVSNPNEPGKYLGSVNIPEKYDENGINHKLMQFDLHLRKTGRKAYGETYGLIKNRTAYNWR